MNNYGMTLVRRRPPKGSVWLNSRNLGRDLGGSDHPLTVPPLSSWLTHNPLGHSMFEVDPTKIPKYVLPRTLDSGGLLYELPTSTTHNT